MTVSKQQPTFEDLELLVEVSQLLTLQNLDTVLQKVIELTRESVTAAKASLFLVDGSEVNWEYIFTARDLKGNDSIHVVSTVLTDGLAGWVVRNREAVIIDDTDHDDRWHIFPNDTHKVRSAMCLPFIFNNEVIAVLTLDHPEPDHFTDYQLHLMTIIINQATVAIRNAQLFQHLHDKQRQLEVVLQSVPEVLIVTDENHEIVLVNKGATELLGMAQSGDVIGYDLDVFVPHVDVLVPVADLLKNPESSDGSSLQLRSDQYQADYAVTVSKWEDKDGLQGHVVVMHDVTTLRDLYRFKDEILHIVSHDLRSPLSIISGYTDMLEFDVPEDSPLLEYTEAIHRSVTRMDNLLGDLLKVRQIDEKGLNLEYNTVLLDLVSPVIQTTHLSAKQKNLTLITEIDIDDTLMGAVDPMLLRQAMENFASNAVKYTPHDRQITLRAYARDGRFYFEVLDNGIGIPEESIPHLFESFYRVNPKANTSINGTGLGLSLVKSIVERHQGQVWVESKENVGSLFGLWVPLA